MLSIWPTNRLTLSRKPSLASPPHAPAATTTSLTQSRKRNTTHWPAFFSPPTPNTAPSSQRRIVAPLSSSNCLRGRARRFCRAFSLVRNASESRLSSPSYSKKPTRWLKQLSTQPASIANRQSRETRAIGLLACVLPPPQRSGAASSVELLLEVSRHARSRRQPLRLHIVPSRRDGCLDFVLPGALCER